MQKLPLDLYPREMKRITSEEVKASNFSVGKEFADYISSTLGPQSAQKAIVSSDSNYYTISSDGKTILQRFDLVEFKAKHPVAQLMVELAKSTDDEVGDGTTSSVILAGELLRHAEKLIDLGLHPTIVANGFRNATDKAIELMEKLAKPVDTDEMLLKVARTSLDTKYISPLPEHKEGSGSLASTVVSAIHIVADEAGRANPDDVHIVKKSGGNIFDTTVFSGYIIEKEMLHPSMPKSQKKARIAVIDTPLMVKRYDGLFTENSQVSVKASGFSQYRSQKSSENDMLMKMTQKIIDVGANVIISRKLIDERLGKQLADKGVIAIQAIPTREDLSMLAGACGAKIVSDLGMISSEHLGYADNVWEERYPDHSVFTHILVTNEKNATILLRGGIAHAISDVNRAVHDALHTTANAFNGKVLLGGGATEMYIAEELRRYALSIKSKKQLAINAFADALEIIPKTLAKNSGQDVISVITDLRMEHSKGKVSFGYDAIGKVITDTSKGGIIESLVTKRQIYKGASETSRLIILSDDIIYGDVMEQRIEDKVDGK